VIFRNFMGGASGPSWKVGAPDHEAANRPVNQGSPVPIPLQRRSGKIEEFQTLHYFGPGHEGLVSEEELHQPGSPLQNKQSEVIINFGGAELQQREGRAVKRPRCYVTVMAGNIPNQPFPRFIEVTRSKKENLSGLPFQRSVKEPPRRVVNESVELQPGDEVRTWDGKTFVFEPEWTEVQEQKLSPWSARRAGQEVTSQPEEARAARGATRPAIDAPLSFVPPLNPRQVQPQTGDIVEMKPLREEGEGNWKAGVYEVTLQTPQGPRKVEARLDLLRTQGIGGPLENLQNAYRMIRLGQTYFQNDARSFQYTGRILGQGSSATIFEAVEITRNGWGQRFAVKLLMDPLAPPSPDGRARFDRDIHERDYRFINDEARIQKIVAEFDPAYEGLSLMDAEEGRKALVMPILDSKDSRFFYRLKELSAADQQVAKPQVLRLIEELARRNLQFKDNEFALAPDGKVHLIDLQGLRPPSGGQFEIDRIMEITGLSEGEVRGVVERGLANKIPSYFAQGSIASPAVFPAGLNPFQQIPQVRQEVVVYGTPQGQYCASEAPGATPLFKLVRGPRGYFLEPLVDLRVGKGLNVGYGGTQPWKGQRLPLQSGELQVKIGEVIFSLPVPEVPSR
jgi:hypothetical protein